MTPATARRVAGLVSGLALVASSRPGNAYVRHHTDNGTPLRWTQNCVGLVAYPDDFTMMPLGEIMAALDASATAWSKAGNACTYLDISATLATGTLRVSNDGQNAVIFRTRNWCMLNDDGTCDTRVRYDPSALALTSVFHGTTTGQIRGADIEVNASGFDWGDLIAHPELAGGGPIHDLQNALTHEMGHLVGLDHTCFVPGSVDAEGNPLPWPVDHTGSLVSDCAAPPPDVLATTMFPSAVSGDIEKRSLSPDDQLAVCEIYPTASDPNVCGPADDGCGCVAGDGRPGAGALLLVGVFGTAVLRTRRPRSSRRGG